MRLRTTAPPNAFLMLKPNRLCGSWFTRKKTVKWELERRFPERYTASKSPRCTSRAARGKSRRPELLGRKPMATLLATRRKHLAAALALHTRAETVGFRPTPSPRLISSLRQSNPPQLSLCIRIVRPPFSSVHARNLWPLGAAFEGEASPHPSTVRFHSAFRTSKCSRPLRTRSRNRGVCVYCREKWTTPGHVRLIHASCSRNA
jgi:hypothetical protein